MNQKTFDSYERLLAHCLKDEDLGPTGREDVLTDLEGGTLEREAFNRQWERKPPTPRFFAMVEGLIRIAEELDRSSHEEFTVRKMDLLEKLQR